MPSPVAKTYSVCMRVDSDGCGSVCTQHSATEAYSEVFAITRHQVLAREDRLEGAERGCFIGICVY